MKKIFSFLLILICLPLALSAKEYTINIGDFSRLKVNDNINVVYRCTPDSAGIARFDCPDELASAFLFHNPKNETLKIEVSMDYEDCIDQLPTLYVYSEFLTQVETNSSGQVVVESPLRCPEFKGKLVGNGQLRIYGVNCQRLQVSLVTGNGLIVATGIADDLKCSLTGTGTIDLNGVQSKNVNCNVLGTGSIHCHPAEQLTLKGLGSTTVYYTGSPIIKKQGLGKLVRVGD